LKYTFAERTIPPPLAATEGALLITFLINGANGILERIRVVKMGHPFAQTLHAAICAQAEAPWEAAAYDAHLARLQTAPSAALAQHAQPSPSHSFPGPWSVRVPLGDEHDQNHPGSTPAPCYFACMPEHSTVFYR